MVRMSEEEIIYILKKRIERKTVSSDPYYITQQAIERYFRFIQ